MDDELPVRPLAQADHDLLVRATLGNLNWCGERFSRDDVLSRPDLEHYTSLVPSRGDYGYVVQQADDPIAVAWAQFLPADDPGYGYIDEHTPELSIWVAEPHRGRGLGRTLIRLLQDEATRRGIPAMSLSVEDGNPARRLYDAMGFMEVAGRQADGVMLWHSPEGQPR